MSGILRLVVVVMVGFVCWAPGGAPAHAADEVPARGPVAPFVGPGTEGAICAGGSAALLETADRALGREVANSSCLKKCYAGCRNGNRPCQNRCLKACQRRSG